MVYRGILDPITLKQELNETRKLKYLLNEYEDLLKITEQHMKRTVGIKEATKQKLIAERKIIIFTRKIYPMLLEFAGRIKRLYR